MPNIDLTDLEAKLAIDLLEREASQLHEEIRRTDQHDYRERLKQQERTLAGVVRKLKEAK